MYIKIIQATHEHSTWYKDLVGKEFEVYMEDTDHRAYTVDNIDGTGLTRGNIFYEDCVEIEELTEENKFIPPTPSKTKEELMQETIDILILNSL